MTNPSSTTPSSQFLMLDKSKLITVSRFDDKEIEGGKVGMQTHHHPTSLDSGTLASGTCGLASFRQASVMIFRGIAVLAES